MGNQFGRAHREAFNGLKRSSIQAPRSMATEMSPATGSALAGSRLFNDQPCPSQHKSAAGIWPNDNPSHTSARVEPTMPIPKLVTGIPSRPSSHAELTIRPASVSNATAARQALKRLNETCMTGDARMGARK